MTQIKKNPKEKLEQRKDALFFEIILGWEFLMNLSQYFRFFLGGAILTTIYRSYFEATTDVAGMLLILAIMFVVIHLPLMLFVRVMGDDDDDDEEDDQVVTIFF